MYRSVENRPDDFEGKRDIYSQNRMAMLALMKTLVRTKNAMAKQAMAVQAMTVQMMAE